MLPRQVQNLNLNLSMNELIEISSHPRNFESFDFSEINDYDKNNGNVLFPNLRSISKILTPKSLDISFCLNKLYKKHFPKLENKCYGGRSVNPCGASCCFSN